MGIDIYMRWKGQSKEEEEKQITGFSIAAGHVGYLREAYHGEPYATRILVSEAFNGDEKIKAETLRERLPQALEAIKKRYSNDDSAIKWASESFENFVSLAEQKEKETGEPVTIIASW